MITTDLGTVTAYAEAVAQGYTGTKEEFGKLLANYAKTAEKVAEDKVAAEQAMESAKESANRASTSEQNAKASENAAAEQAKNVSDNITELVNKKDEALQTIDDKTAESVNAVKRQEETSAQNVTNHTDSEIQRLTQETAESKNSLDGSIATANDTKSQVDVSVEAGKKLKADLDKSIADSGKAKTALDGSVTAANVSKSALDETVGQANTLDTSLSSKIAEGTQLNKDITASGQKAVSDINSASTQALSDINTAGAEKLDAVNKAAEAIVADREQITKNKTGIDLLNEEMTNVKAVMDSIDERILEAFFGSMRNGKVYQTEVYLTETNQTSDGVKTLANANMVCEPSTDTVEGRDDYEGIGIFNWYNCNYVTDDYGRKIPTAIEGWGNGYKNDGSVDVGVIAMTPYWSVIEKNGKQIWTLSDTPNDNYGLIPWETAKKEDGTYASYVIHSKYISGLGIDGLLRSFFNSKPFRNNCYNNMIENYQKKGKACWGAGKERDMYVILHVVIKYATKNEQKIFKGTTSYNLQFSASIQRETKETYFPLTNSQASQIVVGSYVSVGYGSKNTDNTVNNDRGVGTIHQYADDVKVLRIDDIDENNKAVYLDIEEGFTTTPVALSDTLNAQIMLSTMHWWSGTTDKVIGKHDGSMGSNTDGKHPFRVMGIECSVGGYIVYSDSVMVFKEDYSKDVYIAPRGVKHVKDEATIKSTYKLIGNMPGNGGTDWWIGDIGVDMETCSWFAKAVGKSDSQGWGDRCYAGGKSTSGTREDIGRGSLWDGSSGGSVFVSCWYGLAWASWSCLGCD
ncbi:hypothetical protein ACTM96_07390 [Mediterraneibacter faecis]|uniref:hypothetical protein n=1 Tax=Mediterraneibacter faecis TaxID=592978 RepID=UPI003F893990